MDTIVLDLSLISFLCLIVSWVVLPASTTPEIVTRPAAQGI